MPDISKGKKKPRTKNVYHVNVCPDGSHNLNSDGTPQHAAARGAVNEAMGKAAPGQRYSVVGTGTDAQAAGRQGNSRAGMHHNPTTGSVSRTWANGVDYNRERLSAPVATGQAATSPGAHYSSFDRPSGAGLAAGHQDLRQSNTSFESVLTTLRTQRGDRIAAEAGLGGFKEQAQVSPRFFDAASAAGQYTGMQNVNPDPYRPADHQSRDSATSRNGSHSVANPASTPRPSMKSESALDLMKRTMRVANG